MDGTKFENELCEYTFSAPPGYVHTGDAITADTTTSMEILNVFVESGVNSSAHVPLKVKPEVAFNPNADENMPLLYPDGSSLSPSDVDALFRQQAKLITDLANKVPVSLR